MVEDTNIPAVEETKIQAQRAARSRRILGPALIVVVLALLALAMKLGMPRTMGIEREPEEVASDGDQAR